MRNRLVLQELDKKELVHISFNEINHSELHDYPKYAAKLKKIMRISFNNAIDYPYMICRNWNKSIIKTLEQCLSLGFKYAVVWYDGSWPNGSEFEDELIKCIENNWNKNDWLAAGHIIKRKGEQPKWHEQVVVINLKEFSKLKIKNIMNYHGNYPVFKQSEKNIHDDYTPLWLCGEECDASEFLMITVDDEYENNNNILNILFPYAFANNLYIYNFNQSIRNAKVCCYPEDNINETLEWFFDYDFNTRQSLESAIEFGFQTDEDKRELFQFKLMDTHVLYVTNTESVPKDLDLQAEIIAVPCSGLHQFKYMCNNIKTLKKVQWMDFSKFGLAWIQKVLHEWNGLDFEKFFYDNKQFIMDMGFPNEEFIIFNPELVKDFEESFESQEHWLELWDRIRKLEHDFMQVNIVKEWPRVVEAIGSNKCAFIQLSNIWQYEINYLNSDIVDAELAFGNLLRELMINNDKLYLTGDTPNGVHYRCQDVHSLPEII